LILLGEKTVQQGACVNLQVFYYGGLLQCSSLRGLADHLESIERALFAVLACHVDLLIVNRCVEVRIFFLKLRKGQFSSLNESSTHSQL
jgi:hypothetical protein